MSRFHVIITIRTGKPQRIERGVCRCDAAGWTRTARESSERSKRDYAVRPNASLNLGNPSDEHLRRYEHSAGLTGNRLSALWCGNAASRTFSGVHVLEQSQHGGRGRASCCLNRRRSCLPRPMSRSGSPALVPVRQTADLWDRDDSTGFQALGYRAVPACPSAVLNAFGSGDSSYRTPAGGGTGRFHWRQ